MCSSVDGTEGDGDGGGRRPSGVAGQTSSHCCRPCDRVEERQRAAGQRSPPIVSLLHLSLLTVTLVFLTFIYFYLWTDPSLRHHAVLSHVK